MKKKPAPPPPPPKRDIREMSEAEIAELEAWLIELMKEADGVVGIAVPRYGLGLRSTHAGFCARH